MDPPVTTAPAFNVVAARLLRHRTVNEIRKGLMEGFNQCADIKQIPPAQRFKRHISQPHVYLLWFVGGFGETIGKALAPPPYSTWTMMQGATKLMKDLKDPTLARKAAKAYAVDMCKELATASKNPKDFAWLHGKLTAELAIELASSLAPGGTANKASRAGRAIAAAKGATARGIGGRATLGRALGRLNIKEMISSRNRGTSIKKKPSNTSKGAARSGPAEAGAPDGGGRRGGKTPKNKNGKTRAKGPKLDPAVRKDRAMMKKLKDSHVALDDPYTVERINKLYKLERDPTSKIKTVLWRKGELNILLKKGNRHDVKRIRFLRETNRAGDRTPDIEINWRGKQIPEFVEVMTLTQAPDWATVAKPSKRPIPLSGYLEDHVREKIRREQISAQRPGTLVIHAPKQMVSKVAREGWQDLLRKLHKGKPRVFPPGLKSVEIVTPNGAIVYDVAKKTARLDPEGGTGKQ